MDIEKEKILILSNEFVGALLAEAFGKDDTDTMWVRLRNLFLSEQALRHQYGQDQLLIRYGEGTFEKIGKVQYLMVTYGAFVDDDVECGEYYDAVRTEFFHVDDFDQALEAFCYRARENPRLATDLGATLQEISKKPIRSVVRWKKPCGV